MVAYLTKSDASEGFNQVIDFLNGSYLKYALTVNPNIYVSCIKQFWNTVAIKQVNDVTRLQALVDKKKVVVIEAAIREVLRLNDAEDVDCQPNEDIFIELARIGDLSTHTTKYASPTLTQKVFVNMRRVRKGFSGVEIPLFEGMLVGQEMKEEGDEYQHVEDVIVGDDAQGDDTAAYGEVPTITQEPSIPSPTPTIPPSQPPQDIPSTSQRVDTSNDTVMDDDSNKERMIDEMDKDDAIVLMDENEEDKKVEEAKEDEPTEVQEVVDVVTTAKLITEVVTVASEIVTAATINHVKLKAKEDPAIQRYQVMKRKPQIEAQAQKNMMMYLKNVAGFKLDYFKGMSYDNIRPIFEAKFNSNIKFLIKTKEKIEEEENRALHLEIVPDEDDDVYTEATPLARKVPIMDYKIIELNNKPYYKIIRADGTHLLYISFLTLLKNFDKEDLEALRSLVKKRCTCSSLEKSKDYTWSSKGQELEATGIMWCAYHNLYNHATNFVNRKKCCQAKLMLLDNAVEARLMLLSHINAVKPLVEGDVEEVVDLSLEVMEDDEVALVDGVFEGLEVEALVDAIEVIMVDDE
nr:hypothetical protein [Tanacetum cinerariifolium]